MPLPALPLDPTLARQAAAGHLALSLVLAGNVVVHVAGALLHRRFFGTGILPRIALRR